MLRHSEENRNLVALTIVTLLRTGYDTHLDRLLKLLPSVMPNLPDELKVKTAPTWPARRLCAVSGWPHRSAHSLWRNAFDAGCL